MRARWLLGIAACASCGLFPDLADLTAHGVDASNDVSSDVIGDAPADAGPLPNFCLDASHTFCDTFDRPPPVTQGWTQSILDMGALDLRDAGISPPNALAAVLEPDAGKAFLSQLLPTATSSVHLGFWLNIDGTTKDAGPEVDLAHVEWNVPPADAGCTTYGFYIVRDSTGPIVLQETYAGCASNKNTSLPKLNVGWHHIDLDVGFANGGSVSVSFDGTPIGAPITPAAPPTPSTLTLKVGGVSSRSLPAEWTVLFDDVIADVQ